MRSMCARRGSAWLSLALLCAAPRAAWGQSGPDASGDASAVAASQAATLDAGLPAIDREGPWRGDGGAPLIADGAAGDPAEAGTTDAPVAAQRAVLVDTAPIGVDPAAATFVDRVMAEQLTSAGWSVVPQEALYAAARGMSLGFPVEPEGLARLNEALGAQVAFTCELRARGGYYFASVRIRRADERAERDLGVVATQWTLGDRVREAITLLLRAETRSSVTVRTTGLAPESPAPAPLFAQTITIPPRAEVRLHPRPFDLSLVGHGAFNPGRDSYAVGLLGVRVAWFPLDRLGVSGSLSYANLPGRAGRVSNLLPLLGIETGVDLVPSLDLFVPLRAEAGYLPFNGPVLRLTAGLAFTLVQPLRLEIDLLQPTLWVVNDSASVTLDVGAHVTWTFGTDRGAPSRRRRRRAPRGAAATGATARGDAPATSASVDRASPVSAADASR